MAIPGSHPRSSGRLDYMAGEGTKGIYWLETISTTAAAAPDPTITTTTTTTGTTSTTTTATTTAAAAAVPVGEGMLFNYLVWL